MGHMTQKDFEKLLGPIRFDEIPAAKEAFAQFAPKVSNSLKTKASLEKEKQGTSELLFQLKTAGLPEPRSLFHPQGQLLFHPIRRWRFDIAWEDAKIAVELQGFGAHSSAKGLVLDTEKACEAAVLGWTVLPVLYKQVRDGRALTWIETVYKRNQKG